MHGKLPLGVSDSCLLLGCEAELGVGCPDLCRQDVFLSRGDWVLKSVGTGVLSGRDACLLEHLPRLVADGHRHFRIEAVSETPAYRLAVGRVYREALARALGGDARSTPPGGRRSARTRARDSATGSRSVGAASSTSGCRGRGGRGRRGRVDQLEGDVG